MGGVCVLYTSCTSRAAWRLLVILAAAPCLMSCSESPAAAAAADAADGGKMFARGNHWAVGHLMGKKSIESLPEQQELNRDSDDLTASETVGVTQRLMDVLMQHKNQKQTTQQTAETLLQWLHGGWREEDTDKYLREISDLLLLALELRDNDST